MKTISTMLPYNPCLILLLLTLQGAWASKTPNSSTPTISDLMTLKDGEKHPDWSSFWSLDSVIQQKIGYLNAEYPAAMWSFFGLLVCCTLCFGVKRESAKASLASLKTSLSLQLSLVVSFASITFAVSGGDYSRFSEWSFLETISNASVWYMTCLEDWPILTKSATTAFIQFLGDYCAQSYEFFRIQSSNKGKPPTVWNMIWNPSFNLRRGLSLAADGMFLSGPLLHFAFELLEHILPTESNEGHASPLAALLHVLANDYLVDTFYLFISFFFVAIAEGHGRNLATLFHKDFLATLQASWGTSLALIPVEYICFSRLPVSLRVLSMNFIDILWGAIVSFVAHRSRRALLAEKSVEEQRDRALSS